jgi:hypothetical protein
MLFLSLCTVGTGAVIYKVIDDKKVARKKMRGGIEREDELARLEAEGQGGQASDKK